MQLRLSRNTAGAASADAASDRPGRRWTTRIAAAGFMFFLLKGLVWLAIGGLAVIGLL